MPFNQLLLPLLGGFILVTFTHIFSYWTSRQSKEQLLLAASVAGLIGLILARLLAVALLATGWGRSVAEAVHAVAPYKGIGTALLAFLILVGLRLWINHVWPKQAAGTWLYLTSTYPSLERLFMRSILREEGDEPEPFFKELLFRMFYVRELQAQRAAIREVGLRSWMDSLWDSARIYLEERQLVKKRPRKIVAAREAPAFYEPWPLMVTMKDRKVYVGYINWIPPLRFDASPHIQLTVVWSGYRSVDTLKVTTTALYTDVLLSDEEDVKPPLIKVLPVTEITSASFYDEDLFERFGRASVDSKTTLAGALGERPNVVDPQHDVES